MSVPPTRCCRAIGGRQDAAELTEALRLGRESPGAIARRSGASKTSLQRHARECMGLAGGRSEGDGTENGSTHERPTANQDAPFAVAEAAESQDVPAFDVGVEAAVTPPTKQPPLDNARAADHSKNVKSKYDDPRGGSTQAQRMPANLSYTPRHRRPLPTCPDVSSGFEARAGYIADMLSRAAWGRDEEAEHAVRWGVGAGTISQYKRAATVVLSADRGALREQVEVSVAYGTAQRDQAARMAERNEEIAAEAREMAGSKPADRDEDDPGPDPVEALKTETYALKHAREYRKLVLEWQTHLDTLTGVLVTKAPSVQINALVIAQTPEFEAVMSAVLDELQSAPAVRRRVIERVRAEIDRQRADKALPVRRSAGG